MLLHSAPSDIVLPVSIYASALNWPSTRSECELGALFEFCAYTVLGTPCSRANG